MKNDKINEGLIKSWSNEQLKNVLTRLLNKYGLSHYYDVLDEDMSILLYLENMDDLPKEALEDFMSKFKSTINVSGYYTKREGFTKNHHGKHVIEFYKKFNPTVKQIPPKLYHISHLHLKEKILKKGLIPKSGKIIENHPDRVYVFDNIPDAKEFALIKYETTRDIKHRVYVLFEIDTSNLDLNLHIDPLATYRENMFYTHDNISPTALNVIYEGEVEYDEDELFSESIIITKFKNFKL